MVSSAMHMDCATWQQSALVAMDHISEQRSQREPVNSAAIMELLSAYDDVVFDFSAWVEATAECTSPCPLSPASSTGSDTQDLLTLHWYNMVTGRVADEVHTLKVANAAPAYFTRSPLSDYYYVEEVDEGSSDDDEESTRGKDIGAVYEWCAEQARKSGAGYTRGQNIFRFEFGHYQSADERKGLVVIGH